MLYCFFFFCFVFCFSSPQSSGTNQMGVKLTTRHLFIYIFQVAVSHYETNSTLSKSQRSTAAVERAFCIFPGL